MLNPSDLENRIGKLSVVKHAFVRRYVLPHPQIKVEVLEEFPWATIYCPADLPNNSKCLHVPSSEQELALNYSNTVDTTATLSQFVLSESGRLISIADFPNIYQPSLKIYTENAAQFHLSQTEIEQWANWVAPILLSKCNVQCSTWICATRIM